MGIDRLESRVDRLEEQNHAIEPRTLADCSDKELLAMTNDELLSAMGVKTNYCASAEASSLKELGVMIRIEMKYGSDKERIAGLRSTDEELADLIRQSVPTQ